MVRRFVGGWCTLLVLAGGLLGLEAVGTIKKVDLEKGILVIQAGGQERTVKADKNIKVLDKQRPC